MDLSKIDQEQLQFSCGAGNAIVNLYTGRLIFEHKDIETGTGDATLYVSHLYNSTHNNTHCEWWEAQTLPSGAEKPSWMGTGWKLNVQQGPRSESDGSNYFFEDGAGYRYQLVQFDYAKNIYEDTEGVGLTWSRQENIVEDSAGNKMYFNLLNLLEMTESASGTKICYEYNIPRGGSVKLEKIYNSDTPSTYFSLSYNSSSLLTDISLVAKTGNSTTVKKTINYEYEDGLLKKITKTENGSAEVAAFYYTGGKLTAVINETDSSALEFEYKDNRIIKVNKGISLSAASVNASFLSDGEFCSDSFYSINDIILSEKRSVEIEYRGEHSTSVTLDGEETAGEKKKICVLYFFNKDGTCIGALEEDTTNPNRLKTFFKTEGVQLFEGGVADEYINGNKARQVLSFSASAQGDILSHNNVFSAKFQELKNYRLARRETVNYVCSFWIKACSAVENLKGRLEIISGSQKTEAEVKLDGNIKNSWQFASFPVCIEKEEIESLSLKFEADKRVTLCVADMHIVESPTTRMVLHNDDGARCYPDEITSVEIDGTETPVNEDFFMTERDIEQTCLNYNKEIWQTKFTLVCNNGTEKFRGVKKAVLKSAAGSFEIKQDVRDEKLNDYEKNTYSTPHYYIEIRLPDNSFVANNRIDYVVFTKNLTENLYPGQIPPLPYVVKSVRYTSETVQGDRSDYEYMWTDYTGKILKKQNANAVYEYKYSGNTVVSFTCKNLTGNLSGGYTGEYVYDGNKMEGIKVNNLGSTFLAYDSNGRLEALSSGDTKYSIGYNSSGGISSYSLNDKLLQTMDYDYENNTANIKLYNGGGSVTVDKTIKYDEHGKPLSVKEGDNETTFGYQETEEDPSQAKLTSMYDPYEDRTYEYIYNGDNLTGYLSRKGINGAEVMRLSAQANANVASIWYYIKGQHLFTDEFRCDAENRIEWAGDTRYHYNETGKVGKIERLTVTTGHQYCLINYDENTALPIAMQHEVLDMGGSDKYVNAVYNYKYDNRGNITQAKERRIDYKKNDKPETPEIYTNNYTYNDINQLIREENGGLGFDYKYFYDANGNIEKITDKNDELVKRFEYDEKGKLAESGDMTWTRGELLASYKNVSFEYNAQGVLFKKTKGDTTINYYSDGTKLLAEEWTRAGDPVVYNRYRYCYDAGGITGIRSGNESGGLIGYNANFVKDVQGNVVKILEGKNIVAEYRYSAWGAHTVTAYDNNGKITADKNHIAYINPFRWKGHYYDTDTGLYFIQTDSGIRYYDPEKMQYINACKVEEIVYNCTQASLNAYSLRVPNPFMYPPNLHNIFPRVPLTYEGDDSSIWPKWLGWVVSGIQIAAGIALCFIPGGQGVGTTLIVGGTIGMVGNVLDSQIAGGMGSTINGFNALITGIRLLKYGLIGWIAGGVMITVGAGTILMGVNEIAGGFTGTNYIQDWTGMSDDWYNGLYIGLNGASAVGQIASNLYMNSMAGQRAYALQQVKKYGYTDTISNHIPNGYFPEHGYVAEKGVDVRPYTNNLWAQKTIIKYGTMIKDPFGYVFTYDGYRLGINNVKWLIWHFGAGF